MHCANDFINALLAIIAIFIAVYVVTIGLIVSLVVADVVVLAFQMFLSSQALSLLT